ncbi:MAG: DNA repair protein RadC [bacterium]
MPNSKQPNDYKSRIADWPEDDRPREKLIKQGTNTLSDAELLAIILRVGANKLSALDLARHILQTCGGFRGIDRMDVEQITQIPGIGNAKAAQIKAAIAIGKRMANEKAPIQQRITKSRDIYDLFHLQYRDLRREVFSIVLLTSRNKIIEIKELFRGTVTESLISTREVAREIFNSGAAQVVFVHNHPSGEVTPSKDDMQITRQLFSACNTIEVHVLDHVIIGDGAYYSFADDGKLSG